MLYPNIGLDGPANTCCTSKNLEFDEGGDGVEWEQWKCTKCFCKYVVPIEIIRDFDEMSLIDRRKK